MTVKLQCDYKMRKTFSNPTGKEQAVYTDGKH